MENHFKGFSVEYIERNRNTEADELAKATAHNTSIPVNVFFQVIEDAAVKTVDPEPRITNAIEGEDWRASIMTYLCHYYKPYNNSKNIIMQQRARVYKIINNELYKTSVSSPLLQCISKAKGQELLSEIQHLLHYVRNSNQRHRSETRANAMVSDQEKQDVTTSSERNWLNGG
jgi:hypothetical protein